MLAGLFFAGVLFTAGLLTCWEVPGCLQPMAARMQEQLPPDASMLMSGLGCCSPARGFPHL